MWQYVSWDAAPKGVMEKQITNLKECVEPALTQGADQAEGSGRTAEKAIDGTG